MSPEAARRLRASLGVTCFLDLRTDEEVRRRGEPFGLIDAGITWRRVPVRSYAEPPAAALAPTALDYARSYMATLDHNGAQFAELMGHLADAREEGYVVGCYAGKDRTGLGIALLFALVGATREAIMQDFLLSDVYLRRDAAHFRASWEKRGMTPEQYLDRIAPREHALAVSLEHLSSVYGGVEAFLRRSGMPEALPGVLRRRFAAHVKAGMVMEGGGQRG